ncbi:MAG: DUF4922 domain-containing protein [Bacteroidaceae bacterium]|nr:DUF4922 domain-containing protein [Bacteroidaceae bacterium]
MGTQGKDIRTKVLYVGGMAFHVQFNAARIRSSAAKTDAVSIAHRPCFLCKENRPPTQISKDWKGKYEILENPFPIFPQHLTIPTYEHIPQLLQGRYADMLALAKEMPQFTVFFNGPRCGASAPDHMHFQAGSRLFMPIEQQWQERIGENLAVEGKARLHLMANDPRNTLLMIADEADDAVILFEKVMQALNAKTDSTALTDVSSEPMVNVLCYYENGQWFTFIFPRTQHRPACYFAEGDDQMIISPASVDLGGVFITVREKDFERLDATKLEHILREVCWQDTEIETFKNELNART